MKLLMIDNYDSFTYNIVQYFGELGADVQVVRNDEITLDGVAERIAAGVQRLVISPGPCSPAEAGARPSNAGEASTCTCRFSACGSIPPPGRSLAACARPPTNRQEDNNTMCIWFTTGTATQAGKPMMIAPAGGDDHCR